MVETMIYQRNCYTREDQSVATITRRFSQFGGNLWRDEFFDWEFIIISVLITKFLSYLRNEERENIDKSQIIGRRFGLPLRISHRIILKMSLICGIPY